ncbi:unnamed protein product, partial [Polarella glacialis]
MLCWPGPSDPHLPEFLEAIGASRPEAPEPPLLWWRSRAKADAGARLSTEWGMLEALQLPGDTVFVPQGWWHQVLNLDFTTSVTQNFVLPSMLPVAFQEWKRKWPKLLTIYKYAEKGSNWPEPEADDAEEHQSGCPRTDTEETLAAAEETSRTTTTTMTATTATTTSTTATTRDARRLVGEKEPIDGVGENKLVG